MNPTIEKFGWPATLVHEFEHWLVLVRPAQPTLGSLVLAAKSDATAYGDLPREAFTEQADAIAAIEGALRAFTAYERINYATPAHAIGTASSSPTLAGPARPSSAVRFRSSPRKSGLWSLNFRLTSGNYLAYNNR
jgi:hypothetical protein